MIAHMNTSQRDKRNAEEFRRQIGVLHLSAVGVILCRSREPFRAIDALREFAFGERLDFKVWSLLYGWSSYDRQNPDEEPQVDNISDPLAALKAINGIGGDGRGFNNGVFAMMYPHFALPRVPQMIQCIKEYCRIFSEGRKRLVLIVPQAYSLPPELEDDVVIVDFETPSFGELEEIYDRLQRNIPEDKRPNFNQNDKERILSAGAGMVAAEFESATSRALVTNRAKLPRVPVDDMVAEVLKVKTEVVKRSEVLELMQADDMANVGGLTNLKDWVRKRARCFGQEAKDYGVEAPKGIALIGPPGTGKSLTAKATANLLGLPLIKFDVGRVFQSLVGQSEERVRGALKMVDGMAPCVLMIDEADKAFQNNQSGGDGGVGKRVLGAILTWMQETKAPVFVVVTANRVDNLPSEFLRRGRLDEIFSVSMPSAKERRDVLEIHLRKRMQDPAQISNLDLAVTKSEGYVPAEIEAAVKDALIEAYVGSLEVTGELISAQLEHMVPLSEAFADQFQAMQLWAEQNARPANSQDDAEDGQSAKPVRKRARAAPRAGNRKIGLDG